MTTKEDQAVVLTEEQIDKKRAVEKSVRDISKEQPFLAALLNQIDIIFDDQMKIAAISFDKKTGAFHIRLHPDNFCKLGDQQRVAVLLHEVMHFSHGHLVRMEFEGKKGQELLIQNVAADVAINQFIKNLPEGCVYPKTFNLPDNKTFEWYHEELKKQVEEEQQKQKGKGEPGDGMPENMETLDEHGWSEEDEMSEADKQQMMQAAKRTIERALEKCNRDKGSLPDDIRKLYDFLDGATSRINYRQILESCIKKSITHVNRKHTWNRRNKRYGVFSPGTKNGDMPRLGIFVDTSGSISREELGRFFGIIDGFLKAGANRCHLGLWDTTLYHYDKFKLGTDYTTLKISGGGTTITEVMEKIDEEAYDLAIVITDGYYCIDNKHTIRNKNLLWVISDSNHNKLQHPYIGTGKTIPMQGILDD